MESGRERSKAFAKQNTFYIPHALLNARKYRDSKNPKKQKIYQEAKAKFWSENKENNNG